MDALILQAILHENRFDERELKVWQRDARLELGEPARVCEADQLSDILQSGLTGGCKS